MHFHKSSDISIGKIFCSLDESDTWTERKSACATLDLASSCFWPGACWCSPCFLSSDVFEEIRVLIDELSGLGRSYFCYVTPVEVLKAFEVSMFHKTDVLLFNIFFDGCWWGSSRLHPVSLRLWKFIAMFPSYHRYSPRLLRNLEDQDPCFKNLGQYKRRTVLSPC